MSDGHELFDGIGEVDGFDLTDAEVDGETDADEQSGSDSSSQTFQESDAAVGVVEDPVQQALAERDEYLESLRRLQAEFDNYRKRVVRRETELLERSTESLLVRLLPVLDAVDLAQSHASLEEALDTDSGAFTQVAGLLRDILAKEGLERIDEAGVEFDPTIHDAVAHEEVAREDGDERPHGVKVSEILRSGYRLKGKVLRPAMVKVEG